MFKFSLYFNKFKKNKNLKIAVGFFGHLRTYEYCAPYLKKYILQYHDCDLFMHSWTNLDHNSKTASLHDRVPGKTDLKKITKAYGNFKKIIIEKQIAEDLGYTLSNFSLFASKSLFYSMKKVVDSIQEYINKTHIKYDYILLIRPDILLNTPFILSKVIKEGDPNNRFYTFGTAIVGDHVYAMDLVLFAYPEIIFKIMSKSTGIIDKCIKREIEVWHNEDIFIRILNEAEVDITYLYNKYVYEKDWTICRYEHIENNKIIYKFNNS